MIYESASFINHCRRFTCRLGNRIIVGDQKITFGNIIRPLTVNIENRSATRPTIPFLLDDILLTVDRSEIKLVIAIYNHLPENDDYEDKAEDYWKYKLITDRNECPQVESTANQESGFSSFPEIFAWGHPQSNISPSKHLTATLTENSADVKGKYLCLQTRLKDRPAEYSYGSSIAIDWSTGQLPTTPTSSWKRLTREEKLAFNPYKCTNKEQIDEGNGWCLDGNRQVAANEGDDQTGANLEATDNVTEEPPDDSTVFIIGGIILAAILFVAGLLFVHSRKKQL